MGANLPLTFYGRLICGGKPGP